MSGWSSGTTTTLIGQEEGPRPKLWSLAEVFSQSGVGDSNEVGGPSSCASLGAIDVKREIIIINIFIEYYKWL